MSNESYPMTIKDLMLEAKEHDNNVNLSLFFKSKKHWSRTVQGQLATEGEPRDSLRVNKTEVTSQYFVS